MTAPAPRTDTDAALTRIQAIADAALAFRAVERTGGAEWQSEAWWTALYRLRDVCDREVTL